MVTSIRVPSRKLIPGKIVWNPSNRLLRLGAALFAALVAVVLLGAFLYEEIGARRDRRQLQQVGRSVDTGGRTLNVHCTVEGTPTVLREWPHDAGIRLDANPARRVHICPRMLV